MSQIDVSKEAMYFALGSNDFQVTKEVMYLVLKPGEGDEPPRQGFAYAQKLTRDD